MPSPVLYGKSAFDSTTESIFTFNWNGAQSVKNRLVVKNNITNETVYDQVQTTFQLKHTLPANALINGVTYNAVIYSIDINNIQSSISNTIVFKCLSTPSWEFSNLVENQIIHNSSYELQLTYSQTEEELLNFYQLFLYDSTHSLIFQSGLIYDTTSLSYTLSGLNDNAQYYIRATSKTLNGMDLDTGYIKVSVEYISPSIFSLVIPENMKFDGCIKISSNIIDIEGVSNPATLNYINDTMVDLSVAGSYVQFDNQFEITDDFVIQINGMGFKDYSTILELSNGTYKIELSYAKGIFTGQSGEKVYCVLKVYNSLTNYYLTSNLIDVPLDTDRIHIWLRRVSSLYDLIIVNKSV
ncbi:hypothetical protein [Sinanaerobacter chloroacetimidivorans]|uniref:Uncharacterized protein n=1 Tax=Sinanaerobacter chloroacetimidivorans TaxID=2818044 RepID=A0A8J7VXP2_9FIRM|nr:hypothetical protein [Sinanaerobacter chloroacetimidivorans]MBR0596967.1 hypothetical protein [Sinanaerobacter chloroacetimidivorans]